MAARRSIAPRGVDRLQLVRTKDPDTNRALEAVASAVKKTQVQRRHLPTEFDLVVGTNKVPHSLGRACSGYNLTPTVADATFAHAIDTTNLRPDLEVWITVVGVAQPGARIEVY